MSPGFPALSLKLFRPRPAIVAIVRSYERALVPCWSELGKARGGNALLSTLIFHMYTRLTKKSIKGMCHSRPAKPLYQATTATT